MDIGNIYSDFRQGEDWLQIPFIAVPELDTDKEVVYIPGQSLLTQISMKYYGVPYMGKFILAANPQFVNEFDIDEETLIRIPFPLEEALNDFREAVQDYLNR
jgi:hypothetical protein